MRRLVGGYRWGWVQYKMLAGDQGWKGLIRHRYMLHGASLYKLKRENNKNRHKRKCKSNNTPNILLNMHFSQKN